MITDLGAVRATRKKYTLRFIATSYPEKAKKLTGSLDGIIRILW